MRLFISYRRNTWPFTLRLAERLRKQLRSRVFVDLDSVDEIDFENSILRHLRESDVFLLVVSKETFDPARISKDDDWVRREVAEALQRDLPIVMALIEGHPVPAPEDLPEDIRAVVRYQGIEFYPRFFDAGVAELARFIRQATPASRRLVTPLSVGMAALGLAILACGLVLAGVIAPGLSPFAASQALTAEGTAHDLAQSRVPVSSTPVPTDTPAPTPTPTITPTPVSLVIGEANIDSVIPARTLEGHTARVWSLSWSPDGAQLASGGADGLVLTWDAETGKRLRTLEGHIAPASVYEVAFSPNGSRLGSAASDGRVIIWDAEMGQPLRRLAGGQILAWPPEGETLVTSFGNTLHVWNPETVEILETLVGHNAFVESIAFNPDGESFASGSQDASAVIWDAESGERLHVLEGHASAVSSVAWSPDGTVLATASRDGTVVMWHAESGLRLRTLAGHAEAIEYISWSPDGSMLASGGAGGTLIVWDAEAGVPLRAWEGLRQAVYSVAWSPDGMVIATGSEDGTIVLWEVVPD